MTKIKTVSDVPDSYTLITDLHERDMILEMIGADVSEWQHCGLFVKTENAQYTDVLAFVGNVPYLYKEIHRIK